LDWKAALTPRDGSVQKKEKGGEGAGNVAEKFTKQLGTADIEWGYIVELANRGRGEGKSGWSM